MRKKMLCVGVASLEVLACASALAQEAPPAEAEAKVSLERVTVTATKREQVLQDVPISISVTGPVTLEKAHVSDLIDLQSVVPSLKVTQFNAVGQTNFVIRGFGNGSGNDGIESSVGVFVDGVYRSRTSSALDDLPEVERIEVLRGPQSTLFGKNVSAGAISIITAKPKFKFGGSASLDLGNDNSRVLRATVTGPVSDTLALRLSGSSNQRDGFLTNTTTGNDVNNRDRQSVRGDLLWKPSDDFQLRVIADYNRMRETCCGVVSLYNGPATQYVAAGLHAAVSDPAQKFNDTIVFNTDPTNRLSGKGVSAQVDWQSSVGQLTSITAYRKQTNASIQDVDFTGADLANKNQANDIGTFSQEVRLASKGDGPLNWMVGAYFQKERLHTGTDISYGTQIRGFADGLGGQVPGALLSALPASLRAALTGHSNIYALEFLQSLVTPSITPGSTYFAPGTAIQDHYTMDQQSYSLFSNVDFAVTDKLTLSGGLAYLSDSKKAASNVNLLDKFSLLNLQAVPQFPALGLPAGLYSALGGLQFYYANTANHAPVNFPNATESGKLDGDKITGALRAAYDFGGVNGYVSYATGWKAGAYNLSSDSRPPDANGVGRTANPENTETYEAGLKATMRQGFFNLAFFNQTIKGFQSNAYTGTGYSLVNAGKESTRGVEMDAGYQPTDWLSLTASATYLDAKYDSFKQAPCVSFDTVLCPTNPSTGLTPNFRDLSGTRPAGIPRLSISASATLTHQFDADYSGFLRAEYDYSSPVQLIETTPADISTYSQRSLNASFGLTNKPHGYELMLWGRNVTNRRSMIASFPTVAQTGSYSGFPNLPRMFGVTLKVRF